MTPALLLLVLAGVAGPDTLKRPVPPLAGPAPVVDLTPHNYALQDYSRCAQACFAMTYAHSTVPYFSMDTPRNITLVYNQDRVDPKPFVHMNVQHTGGAPNPVRYLLRIRRQPGGELIAFLNGETTLTFSYVAGWARIGGQFNATTNSIGTTGVYGIKVFVISEYSGSASDSATVTSKVTVVNETNSDFARGWTLAGIQRLYGQGDTLALITEGDGSAVVFEKVTGAWKAPNGEFTTLAGSGATGWSRTYKDGTVASFNTGGRITAVTDRFSNSTTFSYYNGYRSTLLQYITDPAALSIRLNYGAWALDSVIDPTGRGTRIDVDYSTRRVNQVVDPDRVATNFSYDSKTRLVAVQNRRGATTDFSYGNAPGDSSDKLTQIQAPLVAVLGGSTVRPTTSLTPWQKLGVPYSVTGVQNATPVLVDSVRAVVTDPNTHANRFTVNRWGQAVAVVDALGRGTTTTYDSLGLVRAVRLPAYAAGVFDTLAYNADGLPTYIAPASSAITNIRYAAHAQPDSIWGTGQPAVRDSIDPDANGRLVWRRVGGQYTTNFWYVSDGRIDSVVDPAGHLLVKSRYAGVNGNRSMDSLPGKRITTFTYDQYGRDSLVSPPSTAVTRTVYDVLNRPLKVYHHAGASVDSTAFTYDSLYLTKVRDPKGQTYEYLYYPTGWLAGRKDPATGAWDSLRYDADGELRRWYNRRAADTLQYVTFSYDAVHRRTGKGGVRTDSVTWSYSSPDARVVTGTSTASTETVYSNVRGVPDSTKTVVAGRTYWRRYAYSSAGLLDSLWGSGMSNMVRRWYAHTPERGTLDAVQLGSGSSTTTNLHYNNELIGNTTVLPGGDSVTTGFTSIHDAWKTTTLAAYHGTVYRSYQADSLGRINRMADSLFAGREYSRDYFFDPLGRLNGTNFGAATSCSFSLDYGWMCSTSVDSTHSITYDPNGNRGDHSATYETGTNRITGFNGCSYTLDKDGNVTGKTCGGVTASLWWSAENRLDSTSFAGTTHRLSYDSFGRLVKETSNLGARYFLWDGDQLFAEVDSTTGNRIAEYSWYPGTDRLHAFIYDTLGTRYFAHGDALGNVIALTDVNKNIQQSYAYDEWGTPTAGGSLGGVDRARFKGALWMPFSVDMHYMRNRWYEPATGRFLSEDPAGLNGGLNPYLFAANDPIDGADPFGLSSDYCVTVIVRYTWGLTGYYAVCVGGVDVGGLNMLSDTRLGRGVGDLPKYGGTFVFNDVDSDDAGLTNPKGLQVGDPRLTELMNVFLRLKGLTGILTVGVACGWPHKVSSIHCPANGGAAIDVTVTGYASCAVRELARSFDMFVSTATLPTSEIGWEMLTKPHIHFGVGSPGRYGITTGAETVALSDPCS